MKYRKNPIVIEAITFDEFVEYGKQHTTSVVNGMPWSFDYNGHPITNENDECYLIPTLEGTMKFTPADILIIGVKGEIYPCKKDIFDATYTPEPERPAGYSMGTSLVKISHDLLTTKYTEVYREPDSEMKFNAPHHFKVIQSKQNEGWPQAILAEVNFQEGPIKECGVNGVCNEDLIAMVICRLEHFQKSEYACRENALAITKLEEALLWLRKRTMGRENRGVEGTNKV